MEHVCTGLIVAGAVVLLLYVLLPDVLLRVGLLLYPKGHARRREFTTELHEVPFIKRPSWVAGTLIRCMAEGPAARIQWTRSRKGRRIPVEIVVTPFDAGMILRELKFSQYLQLRDFRRLGPRLIYYRIRLLLVALRVRREQREQRG